MTSRSGPGRVKAAVGARMRELGWRSSDLVRASGVSAKTISRLLDTGQLTYGDKRRAVASALGWTPGSLDLIEDGGEPEPARPDTDDPAAAIARLRLRLDEVNERVNELEERTRS